MRSVPFLLMTGLSATLSACTEPTACADVLEMLTANVVNATGRPLTSLSVTDTVRRTRAVLFVQAGSPTDTLPVNGRSLVPIFPESAQAALAPGGDEVIVVVAANGHSGSGDYRLAFNGCFVQRLAGPDTLALR